MRLIDRSGSLWLCPPRRRTSGGGAVPNLPPTTVPDYATVFAGASVLIDVVANDVDPEGGTLTLEWAAAENGTATVTAEGELLYLPSPGFTGSDAVEYRVADLSGATAMGTVTVSVVAPAVSITNNADGTLTVDAGTGSITIDITSPAEFAGVYVSDTSLLASGPVDLVPPLIVGTPNEGGALSAVQGLWLVGEPVLAAGWTWLRDGTAISGATGSSYLVTTADLGRTLTAVESVTDASGTRSAGSPPLAVPSSFSPGDDAGLLRWYDASDADSITDNVGAVSVWASRAGTGSLESSGGGEQPETGARMIGGLNVLDFSGSARLTGSLTLPASGDVAVHAVMAIDSVTSSFAALLAMDATNDFQVDANATSQFDGRLNASGIGSTVALSGGPYFGPIILSMIFDRTGAETFEVFVNGILRGSGPYAAPLDPVQTLALMTNRSRNAFVNGAVAEVIVTGTLFNRSDYHAYLTAKWGIV